MAVGDVKSGISSVSANGYLSIRPPTGEEWVIHNIYHEHDIELIFTDGSHDIVFDSDSGSGVYARYAFHVTNSVYLKVHNKDTSTSRLIGYDGVQTK